MNPDDTSLVERAAVEKAATEWVNRKLLTVRGWASGLIQCGEKDRAFRPNDSTKSPTSMKRLTVIANGIVYSPRS
jgi:hypothetical protein